MQTQKYSYFLFNDDDVPFLQDLCAYLEGRTEDLYERLVKRYRIQHEQDLYLLVHRMPHTVVARDDYILIILFDPMLARKLDLSEGRINIVVAKDSAVQYQYVSFISSEQLRPTLPPVLPEVGRHVWHMQGNLMIQTEEVNQHSYTEAHSHAARKRYAVGRHAVTFTASQYIGIGAINRVYLPPDTTVNICCQHDEHGRLTLETRTTSYTSFRILSRHDRHITAEILKELANADAGADAA